MEALEHEWGQNPPVHYLVAAYLEIDRPAEDDESDDEPAEASPQYLAALGSLAPPLQASAHVRAAVAAASSDLDALAVLERMHFGEMTDVGRR